MGAPATTSNWRHSFILMERGSGDFHLMKVQGNSQMLAPPPNHAPGRWAPMGTEASLFSSTPPSPPGLFSQSALQEVEGQHPAEEHHVRFFAQDPAIYTYFDQTGNSQAEIHINSYEYEFNA